MMNSYFDLIDQTYYFPQDGFDIQDEYLMFHGISLKYLIEKYGTPFRLIYLPRIREQVRRARNLFRRSMNRVRYQGNYHYCYCTKCCHFAHVVKTALKEGVHLETSSSFDIDLIRRLWKQGDVTTSTIIVNNGYKTPDYIEKILALQKDGFKNVIPVIDTDAELDRISAMAEQMQLEKIKVGIRMAIDEEPQSAYYTSRLGVRRNEVVQLFHNKIKDNPMLDLRMLHFFVDSGIKDNLYYWGEFQKAMELFTELKRVAPTLTALNLGGGFPIRNNLGFEYDYDYIINEIVSTIKDICSAEGVDEPDIFTEFGKYTVGESGAIIFSVLEQKQQNQPYPQPGQPDLLATDRFHLQVPTTC